MMLFSPLTQQRLLYTSVGLSAFSIYKHTSISINDVFPVLDKSLGAENATMSFSAKSNYLQVSATIATMAILQLKWAKYGITNPFDKVLLAWYGVYSFGFGLAYFMKGWYLPLVPMWGIPALTWMSQL